MGGLLLWTILVPLLAAAVVVLCTPKDRPGIAGPLALIGAMIPLGFVIALARDFSYVAAASWQHELVYRWAPELGLTFIIGMDSISLWLVVLTAVLTPIAILASFNYIKQRQPEFYAWMLILHAAMIGVFVARDILLFYFFFEFTLVPMFFIIGIWGGQQRRYAAGKFFLFTFAGSVLTLAALIYLAYLNYKVTGILSFTLADLRNFTARGLLDPTTANILFLGLLAGFAVKVPLFPVHTWLPLAHTEAPTAGSVILAGVLLKLGTYGLLRFGVGLLPGAALYFAPLIGVICVIGIIYGALVSWVQTDMKKLIAYSSVSHLAFCVLGLFALTPEGITGSILYMINHGLSTGALFLVVGMIYERYHTREMAKVSGLARRVPALGFFAVFFVFSSVALPGLNGFVSEFLALLGTFVSGRVVGGVQQGNLGPMYAVIAATGVILGAVYLLYWAGKIIYGPLEEPHEPHETHHEEGQHGGHGPVKDLSFREWAVLTPLAIAVIILGVAPNGLIQTLQDPVKIVARGAWTAPATPTQTLHHGVTEARR